MTTVSVDAVVGLLTVSVGSTRSPMGYPKHRVITSGHDHSDVTLVGAPCFGRIVRVVQRKRTWYCGERSCVKRVFTQQDPVVVAPRAGLTMRVCWWAVKRFRREHASAASLARQLRITWNTLWSSIKPTLQMMANDMTRFTDVKRLGVDEYVWYHVSELPINRSGYDLKQLTGVLDLTPGY